MDEGWFAVLVALAIESQGSWFYHWTGRDWIALPVFDIGSFRKPLLIGMSVPTSEAMAVMRVYEGGVWCKAQVIDRTCSGRLVMKVR